MDVIDRQYSASALSLSQDGYRTQRVQASGGTITFDFFH